MWSNHCCSSSIRYDTHVIITPQSLCWDISLASKVPRYFSTENYLFFPYYSTLILTTSTLCLRSTLFVLTTPPLLFVRSSYVDHHLVVPVVIGTSTLFVVVPVVDHHHVLEEDPHFYCSLPTSIPTSFHVAFEDMSFGFTFTMFSFDVELFEVLSSCTSYSSYDSCSSKFTLQNDSINQRHSCQNSLLSVFHNL